MEGNKLEKPYKQRFKGVENFLRRVAFNLGNTPSQTEVKVISCIPIDVTDLQQKIISLEKQLHEAQQLVEETVEDPSNNSPDQQHTTDKHNKVEKPGHSTVVNTAFVSRSSAVSYNNKKPVEAFRTQQVSAYCEDCSSRQRKSNVSFVFPAIPTTVEPTSVSRENCNNEDNDDFERRLGNDLYKNIFRRRKKKKVIGKSKIKTQLIYYAQESPKSPFHIKDKSLLRNQIMNNDKGLSQSYLERVVRKHYDQKNILEEFSDTSHFSKPICRDMDDNLRHPSLYESDVCSCCYGKFQNLDNFMTKNLNMDPIRPWLYKPDERDKTYYDSNLYDMIPVKENSNKFSKPEAIHTIDYKRQLDMKCWPEKYRTKCKYHPFIVNYQSQIPVRRLTHNKHIEKSRFKLKQIKKTEKHDFETSKSCSVEYSDIYRKIETPGVKLRKSEPTRRILLKNEFAETDNNTLQVQPNNQSTQSKLFPTVENKTESTLNQIKSILQSVLQEVKTNSNINTVSETPKKDAVIQKGSSQNNMSGNSTLLHSFTYNNSCNTNPYLPSYSRQMSPGQYGFQGMSYQPMKYLQNFPVFIHPASGRPMCACYYRHSSHKSSHNKQATISTNTDKDIQPSSSNETEKLIKEIYKSMALNMDYPTKENSMSESEDFKSTELNSINVSNREEKSTEAEILKKRDIEIEAMLSPLVSNPNENKFVYIATSSSENNRFISDLSFGYTPARNTVDERNFKGVEKQSADTIDEVEEGSDESSDETESDETIVLDESKQNKKEKKGLFKRMFNSVKLFKKRKAEREKGESDEEQSEDSDSDDYQTLHSSRTDKETPKEKVQPNRRKQYSKVKTVIDQKSKRKDKRSPYLEQEYRRQWNENLMFHDQQERYSSERPFSKPTTSQPSAQPIYWKNYEARRVSVKPNVPTDVMIQPTLNGKTENGNSSPNNIAENGKGKLAWIKKHNLGIHCGEQWKKFILEN